MKLFRRSQKSKNKASAAPASGAEQLPGNVVDPISAPAVDSFIETSTGSFKDAVAAAPVADDLSSADGNSESPALSGAEVTADPAPMGAESTSLAESQSDSALQPVTQRKPNAPAAGGFYTRLKRGLSRTGNQFASTLGDVFLGSKVLDADLMEELESQLLMSDLGIEATTRIMDTLAARVTRKELNDGEAVLQALQAALYEIIAPCEQALDTTTSSPFVILVVGVNGAGKTTTIGKMAHRYKAEGRRVMLAAGDTFRAAAVEQLQSWGERNQVPVIAQHTGADSASVLFDALQAARARGADVLIADTAGRLQNKAHLMDELEKVVRVMRKLDPTAPHETLLVLDAGTGQNAVSQAEQFDRAVGVTGLALTKLDGTARGGVIFAIAERLKKPIRYIGVGEGAEDLRPFVAKDFVEALFDRSSDHSTS